MACAVRSRRRQEIACECCSYVAVPARVDGVQAFAPAARDGVRESLRTRSDGVPAANTDASWRPISKLVSCYASYAVKNPRQLRCEPSAGPSLRARALSETARRPSAESKVPAGSVATGALRRLSNRRVAANAARTPPPRRRTHARVVGRTPCAVAAPLPCCGQPASAPSHQQATK